MGKRFRQRGAFGFAQVEGFIASLPSAQKGCYETTSKSLSVTSHWCSECSWDTHLRLRDRSLLLLVAMPLLLGLVSHTREMSRTLFLRGSALHPSTFQVAAKLQ